MKSFAVRSDHLLRSLQLARSKPRHVVGHPSVSSDRKSTRLNSSHSQISYAVFCLTKNNSRVKSLYTLKVKILCVTLRRAIRTNHNPASTICRPEHIPLGDCHSLR